MSHRHEKKPQLIPLLNFFAETLRETLEESSLSPIDKDFPPNATAIDTEMQNRKTSSL